jgi:hypothetical protein
MAKAQSTKAEAVARRILRIIIPIMDLGPAGRSSYSCDLRDTPRNVILPLSVERQHRVTKLPLMTYPLMMVQRLGPVRHFPPPLTDRLL